ncbi:MAG: hypothetical protein HXY20_05540 [Acidobacteria bacterium]|nr:hypothetical protein [Acidobacteriota bacterium]
MEGAVTLRHFVREDRLEEEEEEEEEEDDDEEAEDYGYRHARQRAAHLGADRPMAESPGILSELRPYLQQAAQRAQPDKVLKSGMRVRHAKFGEGIVVSRQKAGDDFKLVVSFTRAGRKTLMERYAKLEPL